MIVVPKKKTTLNENICSYLRHIKKYYLTSQSQPPLNFKNNHLILTNFHAYLILRKFKSCISRVIIFAIL